MFWPFIALAVGCDCDPADAETSSPDKTSVSTYSQSVHGGSMRKERHLRGQSERKDAEGPEPNRIATVCPKVRYKSNVPLFSAKCG